MPNDYIDAMQIFNKLLKPVFASLHELSYESSVYADDSLLLAQTFQECLIILIMYLPQYPCYRNWGLSCIQQSLYLYQHEE